MKYMEFFKRINVFIPTIQLVFLIVSVLLAYYTYLDYRKEIAISEKTADINQISRAWDIVRGREEGNIKESLEVLASNESIMTDIDLSKNIHNKTVILDGLDLTKKNIKHKVVLGSRVDAAIKFNDTSLKNAKFDSYYMKYVNFNDTDLAGAEFNYSNLHRATFKKANLKNTIFKRAILTRVKFNGALNIDNTNFIDCYIVFEDTQNVTMTKLNRRLPSFSDLNVEVIATKRYSYNREDNVFRESSKGVFYKIVVKPES